MRRVLAMCASPAALLAVMALLACAYVSGTTGTLTHRAPVMTHSASDGGLMTMPTGAETDAHASDGRSDRGEDSSEVHAEGMDNCAEAFSRSAPTCLSSV